jgi:serine/threonine-protein kinase ATR
MVHVWSVCTKPDNLAFPAYQHLGILSAMTCAEEAVEVPLASLSVSLPSASSITEFWPDMQQLVAVSQDLQKTITKPAQAAYLGFRLLQALIEVCVAPFAKPGYDQSYAHLHLWVLSNCKSLWRSFRRRTPAANTVPTDPIQTGVQAIYMEQLTLLAFPTTNANDDPKNSMKASVIFSTNLCHLIRDCSTYMPEANQIRLATILVRLRRALVETGHPEDPAWDSPVHMIVDDVGREISSYCQDADNITPLHRDLQVCTDDPTRLHSAPDPSSLPCVYTHLLETGQLKYTS